MRNSLGLCKKAFTLAEVLITLVIIGVIAALTIPVLLQNIQDAQLKTAWKEAYSQFTQVNQRIVTDNGGTLEGLYVSCGNDVDVVKDMYSNYFNYIKKCPVNSGFGNCWAKSYKELNGNPASYWENGAKVELANGSFISFIFYSECTFTGGTNGSIPICGEVFIDVNGFKGPNTIGRDILGLWIQKDRILPEGVSGDNCVGTCVPTDTGQGCSALYLMQ